ncbi:MAG: 23S rRNA (guanosine(2251)-2'-O)-methyltransferase RlmB [Polyangiales bacterium]
MTVRRVVGPHAVREALRLLAQANVSQDPVRAPMSAASAPDTDSHAPQPFSADPALGRVWVRRPVPSRLEALLQHAAAIGVPVEAVPAARLDALARGARHQGIVAALPEPATLDLETLLTTLPPNALLVALDEVQDPHNFGAILRSAVAFGAHGVVVPQRRSAQLTPAALRASAGLGLHLPLARVPNLARSLRILQQHDFHVLGLASEGELALPQLTAVAAERVALVVGAEGRGLRRLVRTHCDALIRIDIEAPAESLNASVAAAIALHHLAYLRRG